MGKPKKTYSTKITVENFSNFGKDVNIKLQVTQKAPKMSNQMPLQDKLQKFKTATDVASMNT